MWIFINPTRHDGDTATNDLKTLIIIVTRPPSSLFYFILFFFYIYKPKSNAFKGFFFFIHSCSSVPYIIYILYSKPIERSKFKLLLYGNPWCYVMAIYTHSFRVRPIRIPVICVVCISFENVCILIHYAAPPPPCTGGVGYRVRTRWPWRPDLCYASRCAAIVIIIST